MTRPPADLVDPDIAAEPLRHNDGNQATGGIWRTTYTGRPAVLKIASPGRLDGVAHWSTSDDPAHWNYWRREVEAYTSGLAGTAYAGAGIDAPELLAATPRPDGSIALWLAEVPGTPGTAATSAQLAAFAGRLGAAHARWVDAEPPYPWLSRNWLRAYSGSRPVAEPVPWDHPVPAAAWPEPLRAGLRRLWERRYDVLDAAERLPRTLCHHDVWPNNLIISASGPVLFDWSFVGTGAVGEDAANLVLDTFFDGLVPISALPEVVEGVTAAYQEGLSAVVPADEVRRAIMVTGAAKYFWLAPGMVAHAARGGGGRAAYDTRDAVERFAGRRPLLELLVEWATAALTPP